MSVLARRRHLGEARRRGDRRLLDPRPDRAGRRARHGAQPQRRALGAVAGQHDAVVRRLLHDPAGAVPRRGADHRLHRRDHDPVPVRADAGRPRLLGLGGRDAARPAGRRDRPGHRLRRPGRRRHRPGAPRTSRRPGWTGRQRRQRQHPGDRRAAVHQVPVRLRGHQRAADHRGGRRDGAGPHRARARQPAEPEGAVAGALPHRPAAARCPARACSPRANSVAVPAILPDGRVAEDSLATGLEPQEPDQMPRPTGREQLGSPTPRSAPSTRHRCEGGDR